MNSSQWLIGLTLLNGVPTSRMSTLSLGLDVPLTCMGSHSDSSTWSSLNRKKVKQLSLLDSSQSLSESYTVVGYLKM